MYRKRLGKITSKTSSSSCIGGSLWTIKFGKRELKKKNQYLNFHQKCFYIWFYCFPLMDTWSWIFHTKEENISKGINVFKWSGLLVCNFYMVITREAVYRWPVLVALVVSDSLRLWTASGQAPLTVGISRQAYWSGLPFSSPGDLPDPGIEPVFPVSAALQAHSVPAERPGEPPPMAYLVPKYWLRLSQGSDMFQ